MPRTTCLLFLFCISFEPLAGKSWLNEINFHTSTQKTSPQFQLMHLIIKSTFLFLLFSLPGARSQSASVLSSLQELKEVQDNLNKKEAQLKDTERQLANLKGTAEKYKDANTHTTYLHDFNLFRLELDWYIDQAGTLADISLQQVYRYCCICWSINEVKKCLTRSEFAYHRALTKLFLHFRISASLFIMVRFQNESVGPISRLFMLCVKVKNFTNSKYIIRFLKTLMHICNKTFLNHVAWVALAPNFTRKFYFTKWIPLSSTALGPKICFQIFTNIFFSTWLLHFPFCFTTFAQSRYRQLKQQHELKVEEEQILQAKLKQSSFHQQQEELERLRKAIGQNAKRLTQTLLKPHLSSPHILCTNHHLISNSI